MPDPLPFPPSRLTRRHIFGEPDCLGCQDNFGSGYPLPCVCGGEIHHEHVDQLPGGNGSIWECSECRHRYQFWPVPTDQKKP